MFNNRAQSDLSAPVIDDPTNAAPEFVEGATAVRYVEEDDDSDRPNRTPETIGEPVTAMDDDNPTLNYTLSGTDAASFRVTAGDGQLMTSAPLDFETKDTYTVVVTADDGSGGTDQINVTIEVKDRDEWPTLTALAGGLAVSGPSSVSYAEKSTDTVATYTAEGATLSLEGDDAGVFTFSGGTLSFKNTPNYEMPTDADGNNTYMVIVMAADGDRTAERSVTVTVTNVDEEGTVTLSPVQPRVGTEVMATLDDIDGGETNKRWRWARSMDMTAWENIPAGNVDSYTPVDADADHYLRATVRYTDAQGPNKDAMMVSEGKVTGMPTDGTLLETYDTNNDGQISKDEVIAAINDYLFGVGDPPSPRPR